MLPTLAPGEGGAACDGGGAVSFWSRRIRQYALIRSLARRAVDEIVADGSIDLGDPRIASSIVRGDPAGVISRDSVFGP